MKPEASSHEFSFLDLGITPWTVLVTCLIPLLLLMWFKKTYPTAKLAALSAVPFLTTLLLPLMPSWWWVVVALLASSIALVACIDLLTLASARTLQARRCARRG